MRQVRIYPQSWPLNAPFVIARGSRSEAVVVVVEIEQDGVTGWGECTPYPRYGESVASVLEQLQRITPQLEQGLSRERLQQQLAAGAARNAIDCALWDLECRQQQQSVWQKTAITRPDSVLMAQTVSIDSPEVMAHNAAVLAEKGAQLLKIKLDNHLITERLMAIRAAVPGIRLIVDANESWQAEGLAARCQLLADLQIAMLEQPLAAGKDAALAHFIHPLPICADESCHTRDSLASLVGHYDMINIKLDKSGGLTEALALAAAAQAQGFDIMLGCMLCTSRAITAALPLVPAARFVDLDGPTWLAQDVESALAYTCGQIDLSGLPV
ncbi:L-Ala-D/L-Glu epimerase [Erwinia sp. OLTSP20]|uniref:L-Ala-D/L-Glu epimerase n=1 Tax=unclassified Erwinia TaxID=2622719 RepID=UPI000C1982A9|nr:MULTISPECIES: L-Ala-D/L-Glu epimerase [unclassified Erwinia]PIJ51767.1 L-Ala-D/L-Glu epimerase [Erwinia sp. OAMSP11]PIJ74356.1 L-Ala-D/L-Glu epimerase [Erwinia sp. OLSSP12]PIJ83811.1 L-Ala-D/L-Glu epimerase [Erwinia sp. OLCASP19]PIJ86854.1 L-Ala-D/L-Glu epimerase [Erwinia sp. OLMTSP26]PIJ88261.1 L-Ala-D/L-Glu epimerase [Erwinia sp. OLMDSP33]